MTLPLPAEVAYGTVRWTVVGVGEDDLDADALPNTEPINGFVTFTAAPDDIRYTGPGQPMTVLPRPVTYPIVNGLLKDAQGRTDVKLVGNDSAGVTPQGWTYQARYELDDGYTFGTFAFSLPANTVVDLSLAAPIADFDGTDVLIGPQGVPGEAYGGGFLVTPPTDLAAPLALQVSSRWGINGLGVAYYNEFGAVSTEAALVMPDPSTGGFTLFKPDGVPSPKSFPRFTTALRPAANAAGNGRAIYDTTLSLPLWSDGVNWRDAAGTIR